MNKPSDKQRRVLGKGLSALIPTARAVHDAASAPEEHVQSASTGTNNLVPISEINPNPLQPRTVFDQGLLQPDLGADAESRLHRVVIAVHRVQPGSGERAPLDWRLLGGL